MSPEIHSRRWLLTAAFLALQFWRLAPRRVRFVRNHMAPVALRRVLTGAFIAVSAASTAAALNSNAASPPSESSSRLASAQNAMPTSPSIRSTLSTRVAATPQIVAYLQSNRPKSEEFIDGHTVWVGTGSPAGASQDWPYSKKGHTIAGTYQALPFSNNAPANWSTEAVTSASAGS